MKIQEVIDAEAALAELDATLDPLRAQQEALLAEYARVTKAIADARIGAIDRLNAATDRQARTLTGWHTKDSRGYSRYVVSARDPMPTWYNSRAWLRLMYHDNRSWLWTLDIGGSVGPMTRIVLDPRHTDPTALKPSVQDMQEAADVHLRERSFLLTDLPAGAP